MCEKCPLRFITSISLTEFHKYVHEVAVSIDSNPKFEQNGPQNYSYIILYKNYSFSLLNIVYL